MMEEKKSRGAGGAARNPIFSEERAADTDPGILDHMVVVQGLMPACLVVREQEPAAKLGKDAEVEVAVLHVENLPLLFFFPIGKVLLERIGIDNAAQSSFL
jgi:hypothetical protein